MSILLNKKGFLNKRLLLISSLVILIGAGLFWFAAKDVNHNQNNMDNEKTEDNSVVLNQENDSAVLNSDNNVVNVKLKTNVGDINLELYPDKAPKTVQNFVDLSKEDFYDGTRFHRVIKDFMIQGGDPLSKDESNKSLWGTGGPGYKFEDEQNDLALVNGVIAMANSGPNTNGSQFFIITAEETPWLQGLHTGFGKVISGMDIVNEIGNTETGPRDQPVNDVIIEDVEISI